MSVKSGLLTSGSSSQAFRSGGAHSNLAKFERHFELFLMKIAKVPVSRWQFVIRLVLVLVLSASLAKLFWLVFPVPKLTPAVIAISSASNSIQTADQSINIEQLKTMSVFGQGTAKPANSAEAPATDTHLNLILVGVMTNSDEKDSFAIIAIGDKQDLYGVGTSLPAGNNVTLTKVMNDRVIISNNGQAETLWLDGKESHGQASYVATPPPQPNDDHNNDEDSHREQPIAQAARSLADVITGSVERDKTDGQMLGYRIRPGRDAAKFQQLGLQADDLVTGINGNPLNSPAKLMEIYKGMGSTTSANLEIKRNGTLMTIPVRL